MTNLIFECLTEDALPLYQKNASSQLEKSISLEFKNKNIKYEFIKVFFTVRRLILLINKIDTKEINNIIKGPSINADDDAIFGFTKKHNSSFDKLKKINEKYCIVNNDINKIFQHIIEKSLTLISWEQPMRWGAHKLEWVRPIRNLMCVFNNKILNIKLGHIQANNYTFTTNKNNEKIEINNIDEYTSLMEKNSIYIDGTERYKIINSQIKKITDNLHLVFKENNKKFKEIIDLCESPVAISGLIEINKTKIPQPILLHAIKKCNCFPLYNKNNEVADFYIIITNKNHSISDAKISNGYGKLLQYTINDLIYYIESDLKLGLEHYTKMLHKITFHAELGSLMEKANRINSLAKYLTLWIPGSHIIPLTRAAYLAKADILTLMGREIPELQGFIGGYYAKEHKEDAETCRAIQEQYLPKNINDKCPSSPTATTLALADKIDTLIGFFLINEIPTGSHDPFGLRKIATSIIKIITLNNIVIPIEILINKACNGYDGIIKKKYNEASQQQEEAIAFLVDKIDKLYPKINKNIIKILYNGKNNQYTINKLISNTLAFQEYLQTQGAATIISTYKRINNIVKNFKNFKTNIKQDMFAHQSEKLLFNNIKINKTNINKFNKKQDINNAIQCLEELSEHINQFFNNVLIKCENTKIQNNRIALLYKCQKLMLECFDFNQLISIIDIKKIANQ